MKATNIARLNKRISFYGQQEKENEMEQTVFEYGLYKTVWASVEMKSGAETETEEKIQGKTVYKIRIRYVEGINSQMLIEYKGRWFLIISINNLYERNRMMELECTEYLGKGEYDVETDDIRS